MPTGIALTIDGNDYYTERRSGEHQYEASSDGAGTSRTWSYTVAALSEAEIAQLMLTQIAGAVTVTLPSNEFVTAAVIVDDAPVWTSHYAKVPISLLEVLS